MIRREMGVQKITDGNVLRRVYDTGSALSRTPLDSP